MANRYRKRTLAERTSWQPRGSRRGFGWRGKLTATAFLAVILAGILGYLMIFSPIFWVDNVKVVGTKQLDPDAVARTAEAAAESTFGPINSRSLFLASTGRVEDKIKDEFDDASKVEVHKKWPASLTVDVTERQSTLLWKTKDQYYLVDQQGIAFDDAQARTDLISVEDSTGLPVKLGEHVASAKFIKVLEDIRQQMDTAGFKVTGFRVPESTFEVQAITNQGFYALFDTTRSTSFQVDALKRAVGTGKPSTYADLRVPGRVYVR